VPIVTSMMTRPRKLVLLASAVAALGAPPAASAAGQEVARLSEAVTARSAPDPGARAVKRVSELTPFTGVPTVLPVIDRASQGDGEWLRVRLPSRPNGHTGWVPAANVTFATIEERIAISLRRRRLTLFRNDQEVRSFRVVVGARRSPTPVGEFFITERLRLRDSWARRAWALATSAFSERFRRFGRGRGEVAIHGRGRLRAPLGTAASHGCVRMSDRDAAWLARNVPDGTPLSIAR
jgi:lipoprotein-anchoring transpeptidase ErfK/SrfK